MFVIFAMTTGAIGSQYLFAIQWSLMAFRATDLPVFFIQFKTCLVVIKIPIFPVTRIMTILATCT